MATLTSKNPPPPPHPAEPRCGRSYQTKVPRPADAPASDRLDERLIAASMSVSSWAGPRHTAGDSPPSPELDSSDSWAPDLRRRQIPQARASSPASASSSDASTT